MRFAHLLVLVIALSVALAIRHVAATSSAVVGSNAISMSIMHVSENAVAHDDSVQKSVDSSSDSVTLIADLEPASVTPLDSSSDAVELSMYSSANNKVSTIQSTENIANNSAALVSISASDSSSGMGTPVIIAIIVGCMVAATVIIVGVVLIKRRRDSKAERYKRMAAYEPAVVQTA